MSEYLSPIDNDKDDTKKLKKRSPEGRPPSNNPDVVSRIGKMAAEPKVDRPQTESWRDMLGNDTKDKTKENAEPQPEARDIDSKTSSEVSRDAEVDQMSKLTDAEAQQATRDIIALRRQAAEAAPSDPTAEQAAAGQAAEQLFQNVEARMDQGASAEQAIETAPAEESPAAELTGLASEYQPPIQGEIRLDGSGESDEDEIILSGAGASSGGAGRSATGGGSGSGQGPSGSSGSASGGGGAFFGGGYSPGGAPGYPARSAVNTPNALPRSSPNQANVLPLNGFVPGVAAGVIAQGILDRRAVRRANERTATVQRALEERVQKLENQLIARETEVRTQAAEQAIAAQVARTRPEQPFSRKERAVPVPLGEMPPSERSIGAPQAERPAAKQTAEAPKRVVQVERLERKDLLRLAQDVTIDATNAREIFEANLIDEDGLRHVVAANLRGEDIRPVLKKELVIHEGRYERDRQIHAQAQANSGTAQAAVSSDAEQAQAATNVSVPGLPVVPAGATQPASSAQPKGPADPGVLIIVNIAALIILGILVATFLVIWIMR